MMRRRELMLLLGGAMTAARALRAQQKAMPAIGFLGSASPGPSPPSASVAALKPRAERNRLCRGPKRGDRIGFSTRCSHKVQPAL